MAGILYICATPIGNLEDMTFRAVRILGEAGLIAAEDTRCSIKLLNHFGIKTPMTSYHEHNKAEKGRKLIEKLKEGTDIALITDAGMPAISDPGGDLVRMCHEEGIEVTAVPGACACVTGLAISGISTRRFAFEGFLPAEKKERRDILGALAGEMRTIVIYEAPHRLKRTLGELSEALGDRKAAICRELTKRHETVDVTTLKEAVLRYENEEPKGEFVIVIEGKSPEDQKREKAAAWEATDLNDHMDHYLRHGMGNKDAMKQVARDLGIPKREIYRKLHSQNAQK